MTDQLITARRKARDRLYKAAKRAERAAARGEPVPPPPDEYTCPSCRIRWQVRPEQDRDWSGIVPEPNTWERRRWEAAADAFDRISAAEGDMHTARAFVDWLLAPIGVGG